MPAIVGEMTAKWARHKLSLRSCSVSDCDFLLIAGAPDLAGPVAEGLHPPFNAAPRNQPIFSRSASERNSCASSCCPM